MRCRSAPVTCTGPPSMGSRRTGGTRRPRAATAWCTRTPPPRSTIWPGCVSCWTGSVRPPTPASSSSRCATTWPSRRSSCSPPRATSSPCRPGPRRSISPMRCTPRWGTAVSVRGSTDVWSPWSASWRTVRSSRYSLPKRPTPGRRGTGRASWSRRGRRPRSASGSPRSAGRRRWRPVRTPSRGRSAAGVCPCSGWSTPRRFRHWRRSCATRTSRRSTPPSAKATSHRGTSCSDCSRCSAGPTTPRTNWPNGSRRPPFRCVSAIWRTPASRCRGRRAC